MKSWIFGGFGGGNHLGRRGLGIGIQQVGANRVVEEMIGLLCYHADVVGQ